MIRHMSASLVETRRRSLVSGIYGSGKRVKDTYCAWLLGDLDNGGPKAQSQFDTSKGKCLCNLNYQKSLLS